MIEISSSVEKKDPAAAGSFFFGKTCTLLALKRGRTQILTLFLLTEYINYCIFAYVYIMRCV